MISERERAITVGELIAALSKFDPSLPVGRSGYFGEFFGYDKQCVYGAEKNTDREGWAGRKVVAPFDFVEIEAPNTGEEHD